MKCTNIFHLVPIVIVSTTCLLSATGLQAEDSTNTNNADSQRRFATPKDAIQAISNAAAAGDRATIDQIFGPGVKDFLTGDNVQDNSNFKHFSEALTDACVPEPDGDSKIILEIGTNNWPFPIPLVKQDGQWMFDTDAGREEIINRHIGRDEMNAIGVCRAYVKAQVQYFSQPRDGSGVQKYALKFKSAAGHQDGLYWESANESSPFSALIAEAYAEGYVRHAVGTGPHPFHGYLFRILTSQGRAAPGGKTNYMVNGALTSGFGLVSYPVDWGKSGIMTFIVNQDGKVYQQSLGKNTAAIASKMTEYNPDHHWTLVEDAGVSEEQ